MDNKDMPAMPAQEMGTQVASDGLQPGLTKREYAAIHIMAGFSSHNKCSAAYAVKCADDLLKELEKDTDAPLKQLEGE